MESFLADCVTAVFFINAAELSWARLSWTCQVMPARRQAALNCKQIVPEADEINILN